MFGLNSRLVVLIKWFLYLENEFINCYYLQILINLIDKLINQSELEKVCFSSTIIIVIPFYRAVLVDTLRGVGLNLALQRSGYTLFFIRTIL